MQSEGQVVRFLLDRGFPIPSPAVLGKIGEAYVRAIERFARKHEIPVVHFKKGESKEQVARRYMRKAERGGALRGGDDRRRAGEGLGVARVSSWRLGPPIRTSSYRRMSVFPNHYYFYVRDREWGPAFIKTCAYAPYRVWIYLNGHEWAKRQAEQARDRLRGAR